MSAEPLYVRAVLRQCRSDVQCTPPRGRPKVSTSRAARFPRTGSLPLTFNCASRANSRASANDTAGNRPKKDVVDVRVCLDKTRSRSGRRSPSPAATNPASHHRSSRHCRRLAGLKREDWLQRECDAHNWSLHVYRVYRSRRRRGCWTATSTSNASSSTTSSRASINAGSTSVTGTAVQSKM